MSLIRPISPKPAPDHYARLLHGHHQEIVAALRRGERPAAPTGLLPPPVAGANSLRAKPKSEWEPWAVAIAAQRTPEESGIVATIERTIGAFGTDAFKLWHAETFGVWTKACNCRQLRAHWLIEYPYEPLPKPPTK